MNFKASGIPVTPRRISDLENVWISEFVSILFVDIFLQLKHELEFVDKNIHSFTYMFSVGFVANMLEATY